MDNIYDRFLDHVAAGRDMNKTAVDEVARGRVWSGRDARGIGLVDEFGGLGDAIRYAVELADLPEDFQLIEHPRVETPFELLAEMLDEPVLRETLSGNITRRSSTVRFLHDLENRFGMLARLNDPRNAYALLPWLWDGVR